MQNNTDTELKHIATHTHTYRHSHAYTYLYGAAVCANETWLPLCVCVSVYEI